MLNVNNYDSVISFCDFHTSGYHRNMRAIFHLYQNEHHFDGGHNKPSGILLISLDSPISDSELIAIPSRWPLNQCNIGHFKLGFMSKFDIN